MSCFIYFQTKVNILDIDINRGINQHQIDLSPYYFFVKIPATKKPIRAPYKVLLMGLEVIIHVPLEQPTNFQYK
jgi:hypothetical protein